jgi:TRAP-type mannitol/chloroaromatic compound transport system permease large subunit
LPGGQLGFLIVVNILVFVLAFFLDFFELAFIIIPLIGPVADKLGIDLVWFGVLLAVNMQTSFMHPPFGFALFYLRSVAPSEDYIDRVTKKPIKKITIEQIYWGAVPFVIIQLIMVAMIIAFPSLVSTGGSKEPVVDAEAVMMQMREEAAAESTGAEKSETQDDQVDPVKAIMESMKDDQGKKP